MRPRTATHALFLFSSFYGHSDVRSFVELLRVVAESITYLIWLLPNKNTEKNAYTFEIRSGSKYTRLTESKNIHSTKILGLLIEKSCYLVLIILYL